MLAGAVLDPRYFLAFFFGFFLGGSGGTKIATGSPGYRTML
jgi:hypothetical protein